MLYFLFLFYLDILRNQVLLIFQNLLIQNNLLLYWILLEIKYLKRYYYLLYLKRYYYLLEMLYFLFFHKLYLLIILLVQVQFHFSDISFATSSTIVKLSFSTISLGLLQPNKLPINIKIINKYISYSFCLLIFKKSKNNLCLLSFHFFKHLHTISFSFSKSSSYYTKRFYYLSVDYKYNVFVN